MSEQIALPKIDTCRDCGKQVIINEERGEVIHAEFFTNKLCFKCYFRQREQAKRMTRRMG